MTTVNRTGDSEIGRIIEVRLEGLTLRVADVRRSIEFYGNKPGFIVEIDKAPQFAMIRVGGPTGGTIGLLQSVPVMMVHSPMSEVAHALSILSVPMYEPMRGAPIPYRALCGFAQTCLQWMKQQFYGIKVWRIPRQVAEACARKLDRLLHTGNLVERNIVSHYDVLPL